jgi:molecular chaperone GrpE (heat shock protein)
MLKETVSIQIETYKTTGKFYDEFEIEVIAEVAESTGTVYMPGVVEEVQKGYPKRDRIFRVYHPQGDNLLIMPDEQTFV